MISLANLRSSAAPWLVLPAFFYMSLFVGGDNFSGTPGYGVASGELAAWGVCAIAPAVAGAAAWEAGRQRQVAQLRTVGVRGRLRQWLWSTAPVLVLHLVLVVGALVLAWSTVGAWPAGRGLWAVAHLLVLPFGWGIVGWVLGSLLPRAVAAPLAAVGSWAWIAMPHSMNDPWVRHLGGWVIENSSITDLVDPRAYMIPWLVITGLAGAAVILSGVRRQPLLASVCALALIVGAVIVGRSMVIGWGYSPLMEPRAARMVCVGQKPALCVPEEYGATLADSTRTVALPAFDALQATGLPRPEVVRMVSSKLPPTPGNWPLLWSQNMPADQLAISVARSAVTGVAADAGIQDCRQPSPADAWASIVAGLDAKKVQQLTSSRDWAVVSEVLKRPSADQAQWFTETVRSQRHCAKVTQ
ncbi:hypothetical protein [Streptomyces sp. NPDC046685]|uniref:DUF7224 domain-containing protein n=1 Tax=Streptomyces sp. NPDC046685 TaxID=3157202 RepID=UPI0033E7138A